MYICFVVPLQAYMEQAQELVRNENILLQTLGFDVAIDHPHTHVVKCCQLVKASKELAQTSYFMATNRCDIEAALAVVGVSVRPESHSVELRVENLAAWSVS